MVKQKKILAGLTLFFLIIAGTLIITGGSKNESTIAISILKDHIERGNIQLISQIENLSVSVQMADLVEQTIKTNDLINNYKSELIQQSGGLNAQGLPISAENKTISTSYFLTKDKGANGISLENELEYHQDLLEEFTDDGEIFKTNFKEQINPINPQEKVSWVSIQVKELPLLYVLANLTMAQNQMLQSTVSVLLKK